MRHVLTPQSRCYFGICRADITPPVGIYHRMWGAASHDRSEGIHRPLTATSMFFRSARAGDVSDDATQVVVAIDHCLLGAKEVQIIIDRAAEQSGIARDLIVLTFSHTHAAGLLNLDRQELPGGELIPPYLEHLASTIAELVVASRNSSTPADIVYGSGCCNLAAHRDFYDVQNAEYVCGYNPKTPADDRVVVARVTNDCGQLIATIVNYACHPTTLAWDNRLISPDYPGAMRETIEQATQAMCVFIQGASGDLGPVEGFVGDPNIADRNGRQLAYAAMSVIESLPPASTSYEFAGKVVSGASIGTWRHAPIDAVRAAQLDTWACLRQVIPLDYREDLPRLEEVDAECRALAAQEHAAREAGDQAGARDLRALVERHARMLGRLRGMPAGNTFPYQAIAWRIGDAIWLAVQGEPYSLLQRSLRAAFPHTPILVATIANGWGPSYLPPREDFGKGIYQETIAALAPGSLENLIETLTARIGELLA